MVNFAHSHKLLSNAIFLRPMRLRHFCLVCLSLLCLMAVAGDHNDTIRVMSLNLHAGHDASLTQIGLLIKQYQPDFVALQEVDQFTHRANSRHQNNRDFITELAYFSGMQGLFGPTIEFSSGHYGIGLLTRHQFVDVRNIKLPHPVPSMEQRGLLEGRFILPDGDTIMVACTHFEAFDAVSRQAQGQFVEEHYAHVPYPVILAGDFNASPTDAVIQRLTGQWLDCTGDAPTFSVKQPSEKIDYILARPKQCWQAVESQVIPVAVSDHFPVIATLVRR